MAVVEEEVKDEVQEEVIIEDQPAVEDEKRLESFQTVVEEIVDMGAEIDVESCSERAEVVLPSTTSAGETIDIETVEAPQPVNYTEIVYSSLPPDLNAEVMSRATRTPHAGVRYIVKKENGKLSITHVAEDTRPIPLALHDRNHVCIACSRKIERNELFLNFPDDLDRRRLWGNALGFKYSEMLRLKMHTGYSLTSIGYICTDHFSEECFRKYNFNKAAIEAFGIPLLFSENNPPTPSKKRTPWDCTVCTFRCFSISEMRDHLIAHADKGKEDPAVYNALNNKGITCPFCRKCTYGYKTVGGFKRHLETEPTSHFYLKRILEVAVKNCRSKTLEPVYDWSLWTEKNVYFAYHGCDVPVKSPMKRFASEELTVSPSPAKRPLTAADNTLVEKSSEQDETAPTTVPSAVRRLDLSGSEPSTSVVTMKNLFPNAKVAPPTIEISTHMLNRMKALMPEAIISTGEKDEFVVESTSTLADALEYVAEEDRTEEGLQLIADSEINPIGLTHNDQRHYVAKQKKTQRQLESSEARLRLFGDETYVEVPRGYKKVETSDGPRLVHASASKTWEERLAPAVRIDNRRFQPLN